MTIAAPRRRGVPRPAFVACALLGGVWTCAALLHPQHAALQARNPDRDDPLAALLGEGRRLFASHAFLKADAYLHRGYYPSIFDRPSTDGLPHQAELVDEHDPEHAHAHDHGHDPCTDACETEVCPEPARDWIERHGRHHFPSRHTHLDGGDAGEILPWVRLAARLDPHSVETYVVGAYWLRRSGQAAETVRFLREGVRANPESPELLFELGRELHAAGLAERAERLWRAAWSFWRAQQAALPPESRDVLLAHRILTQLAQLEIDRGHPAAAIAWLEELLPHAVSPARIGARIEDLRATLQPPH